MYAINLTSKRYAELAGKIDTVIIPTGSYEAHGMHCPLGTDILIPERMCQDLEAAAGGEFLIAPTVTYGYTPSLMRFPGTVTIPAETLISLYSEIGACFVGWGAKNIVFMNGHGGNIPALTIACDRIAKVGGTALAISWWATYSADILKICETQGHAGEDETSAILGIDASLVDDSARSIHMKKAFCIPLSGPTQIDARYPGGMSGDSTKATKEKGEKLYAMMLKKNLDFIRRLRKGEYADPIA
ncbi:MAG: creatininase family protein [Rectinemataceae bacterium]|nr:creatininase family protein [Rectinemataceae bacterium]